MNIKLAKTNPDGTLEYAPSVFYNVDGMDIIDPLGSYAIKQDYLSVIDTAHPENREGFYYTSSWQEIDGQIVRVWTEHEIPEPIPNPYEERLTALEAEIETLRAAQAAQADMLTALDASMEKDVSK